MKNNRKFVLALIDESIQVGDNGRVTFFNKVTATWGRFNNCSKMSRDECEEFKTKFDPEIKSSNGYLSINVQFA